MSNQNHRDAYIGGIRLFNERKFFDAHEVLEDVWRAAPADKRKFLQGLIQLAVGLHHHSQGNIVGAASLLRRGAWNLSRYANGFGGIQVHSVVESAHKCADALERGMPLPLNLLLDEPDAKIGFP